MDDLISRQAAIDALDSLADIEWRFRKMSVSVLMGRRNNDIYIHSLW